MLLDNKTLKIKQVFKIVIQKLILMVLQIRAIKYSLLHLPLSGFPVLTNSFFASSYSLSNQAKLSIIKYKIISDFQLKCLNIPLIDFFDYMHPISTLSMTSTGGDLLSHIWACDLLLTLRQLHSFVGPYSSMISSG